MNWGHGILITIIIFVASILGMVVLSSRQTIDMMDDRYYEKELRHQVLIDQSENFASAKGKVDLQIKDSSIILTLPHNLSDAISSGNIIFMRLSNKNMDVNIPLKMDDGRQEIDKSLFVKGMYQVRMKWVNKGTAYYQTFNFMVS